MENNNRPKINASIKKIKEFDFSKEVTITSLRATKEQVNMYYIQIKNLLGPNAPEKEIWHRIDQMVLWDNLFDVAMNIIRPCFEITLDDKEVGILADNMKQHEPAFKDRSDDFVKSIARRLLEKEMIFAILAKEWNIQITEQDINEAAKRISDITKTPLEKLASDQTFVNRMLKDLTDQKVKATIIGKLKYKVDWEAVKVSAQQNNAQTLKEQDDKKEEKKEENVIVER